MLAALETHPCVDESLLRIPFWSSHIALERKSAQSLIGASVIQAMVAMSQFA
jgi:hypothetical protein